MAMADVAGERSASLPMPASLAKRCRSPDDSLKRCKRHHCHGDSPVAVAADGEVDDGEIIGDAAAAAAAMDVDADSAARGHREGSSSRSGSDYLLQPDNSRIVTKDGTAGKGGVVVHGSKIMRAKGIQIRIDMTGLKVHMKGTGKTDQQLALHEQDDPVKTKITEEARRIKEAVTAKHVPQQVQKQQVEPPAGIQKSGKHKVVRVERDVHPDNWDDAVGYYSYRLGELLDGCYEIQAALGKGVFSTVVRAKDLKAGKDDPQMVAIKIARNNDTMFKAGKEEVSILGKLASADSEDKRHCVRFISNFSFSSP